MCRSSPRAGSVRSAISSRGYATAAPAPRLPPRSSISASSASPKLKAIWRKTASRFASTALTWPRRHEDRMSHFTLADLAAIIAQRANASAEKSYTRSLLEAGPVRAAKKLGEEAVETVIAAIEGEPKALGSESADLIYHLLVVWQTRGVRLEDVLAELERRTSQSGHEEKAARKG